MLACHSGAGEGGFLKHTNSTLEHRSRWSVRSCCHPPSLSFFLLFLAPFFPPSLPPSLPPCPSFSLPSFCQQILTEHLFVSWAFARLWESNGIQNRHDPHLPRCYKLVIIMKKKVRCMCVKDAPEHYNRRTWFSLVQRERFSEGVTWQISLEEQTRGLAQDLANCDL